MVSLLELAEITEEGVRFKSPHDGSLMMLTPEHSMSIQNSIGSPYCKFSSGCSMLHRTSDGFEATNVSVVMSIIFGCSQYIIVQVPIL